MDIDVLYRCAKDLCWQHVKQYILPQSVDLIFYKACLDIYITKKTFWNAVTRLKSNGVFCLECEPENVSDVIRVVADSGYKYTISCIISNSRMALYVWVFKSDLCRPNVERLYRITSWEEDIPYIITNMVEYGKIILLIGDAALPFIPSIKELSRYIIAFGDDDIYCQKAKNEGLVEMEL